MRLPEKVRRSIRSYEDAKLLLPSSITTILIFLVIILDVIFKNPLAEDKRPIMILIGLGSIVYIIAQYWLIAPRIKKHQDIYFWSNAIISGIGLGALAFILGKTQYTYNYFGILLILSSISIAILSDRGPTYLLIFISGIIYALANQIELNSFPGLGFQLIPVVAATVVTETIFQLRNVSRNNIKRLETVNFFSQQINSSLETDDIYPILNKALQIAIKADAYYVGLLNGDEIHFALMFDSGKYFDHMKSPKIGTFSGWVIDNQKPLFLQDLRKDIHMDGMTRKTTGTGKPSLSWMGIPMKTTHINGVLAVSSYEPNSFNRADMELLANLAQHTALALDNVFHHKQVEEQTRLDSLTGTYNHRHFLQKLQEEIDAINDSSVISLIMLDIDFFKSYNDTYGHQVGDMVLTKLCEAIQAHIKRGDFVGRWGGEEFAVALPSATGWESHQVAQRIQTTMKEMFLQDERQRKIPSPTVSQGIAVYPDEVDDLEKLVYLADQRLYKSKERGRNQIEPAPSHWDHNSAG